MTPMFIRCAYGLPDIAEGCPLEAVVANLGIISQNWECPARLTPMGLHIHLPQTGEGPDRAVLWGRRTAEVWFAERSPIAVPVSANHDIVAVRPSCQRQRRRCGRTRSGRQQLLSERRNFWRLPADDLPAMSTGYAFCPLELGRRATFPLSYFERTT
jgi:hypothetical protein